jgi:hypothetical protein
VHVKLSSLQAELLKSVSVGEDLKLVEEKVFMALGIIFANVGTPSIQAASAPLAFGSCMVFRANRLCCQPSLLQVYNEIRKG